MKRALLFIGMALCGYVLYYAGFSVTLVGCAVFTQAACILSTLHRPKKDLPALASIMGFGMVLFTLLAITKLSYTAVPLAPLGFAVFGAWLGSYMARPKSKFS